MLTAADFDYELLPGQIADVPTAVRDQARLLVLTEEAVDHQRIDALPELLTRHVGPRTLLVLNDTKVLPARLHGHKLPPGSPTLLVGHVEFLLIAPLAEPLRQRWRAMYRSSKPLRSGQSVRLKSPTGEFTYDVGIVEAAAGEVVLDFGALSAEGQGGLLEQIGQVPLPPYIERARERLGHLRDVDEDRRRYQTVFARESGSVAAPTAGLHFTPELLAALRTAGHDHVTITLHIGPGTFMPLRSDSLESHVMHSERYHISDATAAAIAAARAASRKVVAVGTTVVRTLESATPTGESAPRPGWGETRLFIVPPYRFAAVDALLTNFHLPRSTLLMLVAALAGRRRVLAAYAAAIAAGYRFYSFGDAMLIPRPLPEAAPPARIESPQ